MKFEEVKGSEVWRERRRGGREVGREGNGKRSGSCGVNVRPEIMGRATPGFSGLADSQRDPPAQTRSG